jgi:Ulp1 family protease
MELLENRAKLMGLFAKNPLSKKVLGRCHELNYDLALNSFYTLLKPSWLCDEVMNAFLHTLGKKNSDIITGTSYWSEAMSTRGAVAVTKFPWSIQTEEKVRNFQKENHECRILVPVHIFHNHWVLVFILYDIKGICWMILDSVGNIEAIKKSQFYSNMKEWLSLTFSFTNIELEAKFPISASNRHQDTREDSFNCGVYASFYASQLIQGIKVEEVVSKKMSQYKANKFRDIILSILISEYNISLT